MEYFNIWNFNPNPLIHILMILKENHILSQSMGSNSVENWWKMPSNSPKEDINIIFDIKNFIQIHQFFLKIFTGNHFFVSTGNQGQ